MRLVTPTFDYHKVPLHTNWLVRLQRQDGINQIANRPYAVSNAKRDRWRGSQGLMNAAKIVVRHVQADGSGVVSEFF